MDISKFAKDFEVQRSVLKRSLVLNDLKLKIRSPLLQALSTDFFDIEPKSYEIAIHVVSCSFSLWRLLAAAKQIIKLLIKSGEILPGEIILIMDLRDFISVTITRMVTDTRCFLPNN